jgi:periplasmic protein TonB
VEEGGSNDLTAPIRGRLPDFERTPLTPPQVPLLLHPELSIDSAIAVEPDIKLPDSPSIPNIGVLSSPNVSLVSNGPGNHDSIGAGTDGGFGPGAGIGLGPGGNLDMGTGTYTPGGGISNPIPIVTPQAEFSDEARRSKYQGICMISIIVDTHGIPQNHVLFAPSGWGLMKRHSKPCADTA